MTGHTPTTLVGFCLVDDGACKDGARADNDVATADEEGVSADAGGGRAMSTRSGDLEAIIGRLLSDKGLTLAIAESCTGGLIGHRITNVPGSSRYFRGSITAYAYDVKESLLNVSPATLDEHGAVSAATARQMAVGVRRVVGTDIGLSATGIAGPSGGTAEKPVGLVYIGLVADDGVWVESEVFAGDRLENKASSAEVALSLLHRYLGGEL